jgi:hypothetical protein
VRREPWPSARGDGNVGEYPAGTAAQRESFRVTARTDLARADVPGRVDDAEAVSCRHEQLSGFLVIVDIVRIAPQVDPTHASQRPSVVDVEHPAPRNRFPAPPRKACRSQGRRQDGRSCRTRREAE